VTGILCFTRPRPPQCCGNTAAIPQVISLLSYVTGRPGYTLDQVQLQYRLETYTDPGATAVDTLDGDLTARIIIAARPYYVKPDLGTFGSRENCEKRSAFQSNDFALYTRNAGVLTTLSAVNASVDVGTLFDVVYSATDAAGNTASSSRLVLVVDTKAPRLQLRGASRMTVPFSTAFTEPGFLATDESEGELTTCVATAVQPNIDVHWPRTSTITYTISDRYGNTKNVVREVAVALFQLPSPGHTVTLTLGVPLSQAPGVCALQEWLEATLMDLQAYIFLVGRHDGADGSEAFNLAPNNTLAAQGAWTQPCQSERRRRRSSTSIDASGANTTVLEVVARSKSTLSWLRASELLRELNLAPGQPIAAMANITLLRAVSDAPAASKDVDGTAAGVGGAIGAIVAIVAVFAMYTAYRRRRGKPARIGTGSSDDENTGTHGNGAQVGMMYNNPSFGDWASEGLADRRESSVSSISHRPSNAAAYAASVYGEACKLTSHSLQGSGEDTCGIMRSVASGVEANPYYSIDEVSSIYSQPTGGIQIQPRYNSLAAGTADSPKRRSTLAVQPSYSRLARDGPAPQAGAPSESDGDQEDDDGATSRRRATLSVATQGNYDTPRPMNQSGYASVPGVADANETLPSDAIVIDGDESYDTPRKEAIAGFSCDENYDTPRKEALVGFSCDENYDTPRKEALVGEYSVPQRSADPVTAHQPLSDSARSLPEPNGFRLQDTEYDTPRSEAAPRHEAAEQSDVGKPLPAHMAGRSATPLLAQVQSCVGFQSRMSRSAAEAALCHCPPGTYILRTTASTPAVVISLVVDSHKFEHHMLEDNEMHIEPGMLLNGRPMSGWLTLEDALSDLAVERHSLGTCLTQPLASGEDTRPRIDSLPHGAGAPRTRLDSMALPTVYGVVQLGAPLSRGFASKAPNYVHGDISREEAEERLQAAGLREGAFLARVRPVTLGISFAIVLVCNGEISHHLITQSRPSRPFRVNNQQLAACFSFEEVVEYLQQHKGPAVPSKLGQGVPRPEQDEGEAIEV
jgi:hypothetical protein